MARDFLQSGKSMDSVVGGKSFPFATPQGGLPFKAFHDLGTTHALPADAVHVTVLHLATQEHEDNVIDRQAVLKADADDKGGGDGQHPTQPDRPAGGAEPAPACTQGGP